MVSELNIFLKCDVVLTRGNFLRLGAVCVKLTHRRHAPWMTQDLGVIGQRNGEGGGRGGEGGMASDSSALDQTVNGIRPTDIPRSDTPV